MKLSEFIEKLQDFQEGLASKYSGCSDPDIFFYTLTTMPRLYPNDPARLKFKELDIEPDEHPGILVRFE